MANETDLELVAENKLGIQKNKKRIFELEAGVSTTYAELMLLLADIGENRALLDRNFASSFTGNRAIAIDNVDDLFNSRLLMIESLEPNTEVEKNFQTMFLIPLFYESDHGVNLFLVVWPLGSRCSCDSTILFFLYCFCFVWFVLMY